MLYTSIEPESADPACEHITSRVRALALELELKLELLDSEIQEVSSQLPKNTESSEQDINNAVSKIIERMSTYALRSILLETFSKFVEAEVRWKFIHQFDFS